MQVERSLNEHGDDDGVNGNGNGNGADNGNDVLPSDLTTSSLYTI